MEMTKTQLEDFMRDIVKSVLGEELKDIRDSNQMQLATLIAESKQRAPEKQKAGIAFGGMIRCLAAAKGDSEKAARIAEKHYGAESLVYKSLLAGDLAAGGALISGEMATDVIELLRPAAIVRRLNPLVVPMTRGSLTMPKLSGGATSSYQGEGDDAGKSEQTTGQLKLTYKKLVTLVPVSNDLLRFSDFNADMIVRDDMINSMAQREDLAFIRGNGNLDTPKGLRYWAPTANVFAANATVNLDNVTADLGSAVLNLRNNNVRMIRPAWMLSPTTEMYLMTVRDGNGNYAFRDEMMRGTLWGFPYGSTTQIPSNLGGGANESEVYLVDMADAVIGEAADIMLDISTEASYVENSTVKSAFSKDETVVRAISEHDFGMRHDASVAVITAVKWAP